VGIQVEVHQLGVVIEHFLEVGDEPFGVDGIAGEASAQLVMHAAGGHAVAGVEDHGDGVGVAGSRGVAEEEGGLGRGNLGGTAEAAVGIVFLHHEVGGVGGRAGRAVAIRGRSARYEGGAFDHFVGGFEDSPAFGPDAGDLGKVAEAWAAVAVFRLGSRHRKKFEVGGEKTLRGQPPLPVVIDKVM
jgi:hypothetical protein